MRKIVFTPIFVLSIIAIVISGVSAFNGLLIDNNGGNSLSGGIALLATLFTFCILAAEQAVVIKFKQRLKVLWIAELSLLFLLIVVLITCDFDLSIG